MGTTDRPGLSRRYALQLGAAGVLAAVMGSASLLPRPRRVAWASPGDPPSIQFDIDGYLPPAESIDGVLFQLGPVFTLFLTASLRRTPVAADQQAVARALETIESRYPYSPSGVFMSVAYGLPYFDRLPGGSTGKLVADQMPRLLFDKRR